MADTLSEAKEASEFSELMEQLREGSQDAAWQLVEQFAPYILRTVRRTLARQIRNKFDSQDFVQAVWASFFADPHKIHNVDSPAQLVALLAAMAKNKVVDETRRRMGTQKYGVRRERSMNDSQVHPPHTPISREPTPSQVAIAREQWNRMIEDQPDHYRRILQLRFEGETYKAIADRLDISGRTVQRVLGRLMRERTA